MLTKISESMIRLHTHTHTHTQNCYNKIVENFYAIFVKNVNRYKGLVKGVFL